MSEYQYYEFLAIDEPLSEKAREEIGSWSSRTTPTATRAVFTYSYSDFPKSPLEVVEKYFDAMLYMANWGSKRLIFRLPLDVVDLDEMLAYCVPDGLTMMATDEHLLIDISSYDEEGGDYWLEDEGAFPSIISLRNDLLNGDYRMLYLAWLYSIQMDDYDLGDYFDESEPPVPANLDKLSGSLKNFVDFFEIDRDLIATAAAGSSKKTLPNLDIDIAVRNLPEEERIEFLIDLAAGQKNVNIRLLKRLRELSNATIKPEEPQNRRTIGELLKSAEKLSEERKKQEELKSAAKRKQRLDFLANQESDLWEEAIVLIEKKNTRSYHEAIRILKQLREVAEYLGRVEQFQARVNQLYETYSRLSAFKSYLAEAGLKEI